jgi:K+-transporting ATPase ATPase C chain
MFRPVVTLFALFTLLTGVGYPLVVTGLAQALFPAAAQGSLVTRDGVVVGSRLIGQAFDAPGVFHGRPSATTPPYNAAASSGSNLGPGNPALREAVASRVAASGVVGAVPIDLVTTSGSGLDPHVSPASARAQVARVARERGVPEAEVAALVERHVEPRTLGLLGEPRVNVLELNLALDALVKDRGR